MDYYSKQISKLIEELSSLPGCAGQIPVSAETGSCIYHTFVPGDDRTDD